MSTIDFMSGGLRNPEASQRVRVLDAGNPRTGMRERKSFEDELLPEREDWEGRAETAGGLHSEEKLGLFSSLAGACLMTCLCEQ